MLTVRRSDERGAFDHGWLQTRHTFSFAGYHDPAHMGFGVLRVINEDRVRPGQGFGTHPHRDMEIVTVVLEGSLEHRDSMGNGSVIRPGEVQVMSAGTGVTHSEFNPDPERDTHLLQIWLLPDRKGVEPRYGQRAFPEAEGDGRFRLLVSPDGREGSLWIHQDAFLAEARPAGGTAASRGLDPGRRYWLQLLAGAVEVGGLALAAGDGLAIEGEAELSLAAGADAALLLFDLP